jgi:hypothetical protein
MVPTEGFKRVPCGIGAAFGHVLTTLPDSFQCISLRRNVQQTLIRRRILHDGGSFAVDRQNNRAFCLFQPPKKSGGVVPKRCQRLNVLCNVQL